MCGLGWLVPALPWRIIGWVWVYNLIWMVGLDVVKLGLYRILDLHLSGGKSFLQPYQRPLDHHAGLHSRGASGVS